MPVTLDQIKILIDEHQGPIMSELPNMNETHSFIFMVPICYGSHMLTIYKIKFATWQPSCSKFKTSLCVSMGHDIHSSFMTISMSQDDSC